MEFKRISVIGLGYIGLPTAAVIASRGIEVIGVDACQATVDIINQGKVHIVEPDLDMVVQAAVTTGKLRATVTPEPAQAFLIAVPTPLTADKSPDLSYIKASAEAIAPLLQRGNLVILESTSPVGTTEQLCRWLQTTRPDLVWPTENSQTADIQIAHCPERVLPGKILHELVSNDRIIGGISAHCASQALALYQSFVRGQCITSNARTAEMAKLTENSYRDVNIAFANELSMICDDLEIDVWELIRLANRHPRVNILNPGPGVGGHCIAVDPWFIVDSSPQRAQLIRSAREINELKPDYVLAQINAAASQLKHPVVACLGIAFKADIDDLRESPAKSIADKLAESGNAEVLIVEPNIKQLPASLIEKGALQVSLEQALQQCNVLAILVDHTEFKSLTAEKTKHAMVVDTRGVLA